MMVGCSLLAHVKRNLEWLSVEKDQVDARPDRSSRITAALIGLEMHRDISAAVILEDRSGRAST
jgi:hypothetical protein